MCDIFTEQDNEAFLKSRGINRRDFSKVGSLAALTAMLPVTACAQAIEEKTVQVTMPDGVSDCYFVAPSSGKHPAIQTYVHF